MSRTDKDKPYWVRAEYYEPHHYCGWIRRGKFKPVEKVTDWGLKYTTLELISYRWEYIGDCDLSETPTRSGQRWSRKNFRKKPRCDWSPKWTYSRFSQTRGVRKTDECHAEFHGPQRMNERLAAREVIKGNHEVEFPDGRTRHSVLWNMS